MNLYYIDHPSQSVLAYLFSYLKKKDIDYKLNLLNKYTYGTIENSNSSFFLFSCPTLIDFLYFYEILNFFKINFGKIKFKIVLGGSSLHVLHAYDISKYLPEITHLFVGKGEEFLVSLLRNNLPNGIYYDYNFCNIEPYMLNSEVLHNTPFFLHFIGNRCSWGKCKFCHHVRKPMNQVMKPESVAEQVIYYVDKFNQTNFYIIDNHTEINLLVKFLLELYQKGFYKIGLKFKIFGMRVSRDIIKLKNILDEWGNASPIENIGLGVEFFNRSVLRMVNKNIDVEAIEPCIDFLKSYGINVSLYILAGLPLINNNQINELLNFLNRNQKNVSEYRISFFLLNEFIDIYNERKKFKIKLKNYYTINDYLCNSMNGKELPPIRTIFLDFFSWDYDEKKYITRKESLEKHLSIFLNPKSVFSSNLFFFELEPFMKRVF